VRIASREDERPPVSFSFCGGRVKENDVIFLFSSSPFSSLEDIGKRRCIDGRPFNYGFSVPLFFPAACQRLV